MLEKPVAFALHRSKEMTREKLVILIGSISPSVRCRQQGLDDSRGVFLLSDSRELIFFSLNMNQTSSHSSLCFGYQYYFQSFNLLKNTLNYQNKSTPVHYNPVSVSLFRQINIVLFCYLPQFLTSL